MLCGAEVTVCSEINTKHINTVCSGNTVIASSCLYRASMTNKTLYYPTDAQIYNS